MPEFEHPFIGNVRFLKLCYPVATIAKRTGESKSNVNAYIRGEKIPPEDFLVRFYDAFNAELLGIGPKSGAGDKTEHKPSAPRFSLNEAQLDRIEALTQQALDGTIRIEAKLDTLLKYSKFCHQAWEKN